MIQIFVNSFKFLLRNKINAFWILLFPIALGTMFYIAFSNLGKDEDINPIPVAIVCEEGEFNDSFCEVVDTVSDPDGEDTQILEPTYCDSDEAMQLLSTSKIVGILTVNEEDTKVTLTISGNMTKDTLNQSILESFVNQFNLSSAIIMDTIKNHPENLQTVMDATELTYNYEKEVKLTRDTKADTYTQYFYNLIAMAALYSAMGGVMVAVNNQGNLSTLAARKNMSSTKKSKAIVGELLATTIFEFLLNLIAFIYLAFILKVGVAERLPLAILTLYVSVMLGVTGGFFLGSIGKKGKDFKAGMVFAVTMPLCFLSGLMVGNMRIIVDSVFPLFNKINPAALISDSFYCLSMYESYTRFTQNIITLVLYSVVFTVGGFLITRRAKYASL